VITAKLQARVLTTRRKPKDGSTFWSVRKLARELHLDKNTVHRIWRTARVEAGSSCFLTRIEDLLLVFESEANLWDQGCAFRLLASFAERGSASESLGSHHRGMAPAVIAFRPLPQNTKLPR